jgi:hypothetical protein
MGLVTFELPENFGLIYSELLQQCWQAAPGGRGISFASKQIKGLPYWYLQLTVGSRSTQHYLGPESPELLAQIKKQRQLWKDASPDIVKRQQLIGMLRAAGAPTLRGIEARVIELLAESGIFFAGGVLVGSHAFAAYQQMLGVRWPEAYTKTMDIDLTGSDALSVALPQSEISLKKTLLDAQLGFFEVPMLDPRSPSTSFVMRGKQLRVDVLIPERGKPATKPVYLQALKTFATPVRFLDYLLDSTEPVALLTPSGVLAHVPTPGRFALHKLVVSQRRPASERAKAHKDERQAALLLGLLLRDRPDEIRDALKTAQTQPAKFQQQLRAGLRRLPAELQAAKAIKSFA